MRHVSYCECVTIHVAPIPADDHMWGMAATWCLQEWGAVWPEDTGETYLEHYRSTSEDPQRLPLVLAALEDVGGSEVLRGVITLIDDDELPGATESPWLAACIVDADQRGRGIGKALVAAAERTAAELGFATLHLYTWSEVAWYERLGWEALRTIEFASHLTTVMRKHLT